MPNENLKKLLDELKKLKAIKDGGVTAGLLFDLTTKLQSIKGDKGDTPQKGIDYFTDSEINKIVSDMTKEVKRWIPKDGVKGDIGKTGKDADETKIIKEVLKQIPIPKDGTDGKTPIKGVDYFDGADGSPDTPEVIREKLESLEDEERLDVKAIKGIEELVKKLEKKIDSKIIYVGGGASGGGRIVKSYDLSASLNGVLKTFSLPAFWRVISVSLTSLTPAIQITDWTTDGAAMTITFGATVDVGTQLSAGQSLEIIYSE